jgi:ADP-ribosyl-[dinitrogen reductase] hydrolase
MGMKHCGTLLGLAIGDALGTTHEFEHVPAPPFSQLASGPLTGIVGGGPLHVAPGQVTDDTQMACCLYASLSSRGAFDANDVAARYVEWAAYARHFDIGIQTDGALRLVEEGVEPLEAGKLLWLKRNRQAAANGSLMRTAPIGVFFAEAPRARRVAAVDDSAITHFDPRCRLACAAFDAAIAAAIIGSNEAEAMWQAAWDEVAVAAALIAGAYAREELESAVSALRADLTMATKNDPELYGPELHLQRSAGFVRIAFRLAFWELLHRSTFEEAVLDSANRGGDADTNTSIVGALVGSRVGVDGIPAEWRRTVLDCEPIGDAVWATAYHPKIFGCSG